MADVGGGGFARRPGAFGPVAVCLWRAAGSSRDLSNK